LSADLTTSIRISVIDAFTPAMKKFGVELREAGKEARRMKDHFQDAANLNQAAEGAGRFGMALITALKQPIQDFANLDQALAKVSAKTGEMRGSAGFEELKKQAEEMGAATKYSAEQVALAQAEFAASGRNTREILGAIPSTLSLATAGAIDLARATEITNEVLNQFNLTSDKTAHVQDVLARADEVSAASVSGLGEALSYAGATAARLNIPLETTSALLASLANAGQKGSTGGTELSAFLSAIVAPSDTAKASLKDLGLSMKEIKELQSQVATGQIDVAIKKMAELNAQLDPRKSAEVLDKVFGERGGRAASVLFRASLDGGDKGLDSLIAKFGQVDGAVERTAKIMEDSLAGSLEKTGGALQGMSTQLGQVMAPTVKALSERIGNAADGIADIAKKYPEATNNTLQLVAAVGGMSLMTKGFLLTASTYTSVVGVMRGATASAAVSLGTMTASTVAMGLAAAGIGVTIGTLLNDWLGLDSKISDALGMKAPVTANNKLSDGESRGGVEMKDGQVVKIDPGILPRRVFGQHKNDYGETVTGWYDKTDKSPDGAPAIVREAIANGARTRKEINAYIKQKRTIRAGLGEGVPPENTEPLVERPKPHTDETPRQIQARLKALEQLASQPTGVRASDEELKAQTKLLQDLLEEMKKNRPRPGGAFNGGAP
jgi:TP901 family phage tail tape measure protein